MFWLMHSKFWPVYFWKLKKKRICFKIPFKSFIGDYWVVPCTSCTILRSLPGYTLTILLLSHPYTNCTTFSWKFHLQLPLFIKTLLPIYKRTIFPLSHPLNSYTYRAVKHQNSNHLTIPSSPTQTHMHAFTTHTVIRRTSNFSELSAVLFIFSPYCTKIA